MKRRIQIFTIALFVISSFNIFAQNVGINSDGSIPNSSAMLDVKSSNKGLLIPQIALTGVNDAVTITTPATSLLVYNTATATGITPGYYYNAGTTLAPVWTRYLTSYTETDPRVPAGTQIGQMQFWNGTAWVTVAPGSNGQILSLVGGIPTWIPLVGPTDILNPTTGKVWMDRNLGATQVALSSTDAAAYGDLYQWGRAADGHQIRTSGTTTTLSSTDNPGHGNFILPPSTPLDWRSPQNDFLWQGVNGVNNPCPSGYRLPTEAELDAERQSWSTNNSAGAFASPLKLAVAGNRNSSTGSLDNVGSGGIYCSCTVAGDYSRGLYFYSSGASVSSSNRAGGFSVRCIKD
jgi:uncharacterized protein (TIGR02145 family)